MLKKTATFAVMFIAVALSLSAAVSTVQDASSPTGYTTTFTYADPEATNVQLVGSFQFYENNDPHVFANGFLLSDKNDSLNNYMINPEDWTADKDLRHANDEGYRADMHNTDGV